VKLTLGFLFLLCTALVLATGDTPFSQLLQADFAEWNPLWHERLPRLIVLFLTGASLAVSGAVLQALFQNPLASPSILGVTCGGCLLVLPVFFFQWHLNYPFALPVAACGGSLLTLLLVYALARRKGRVEMGTLILTGIALSTFFLAAQGALLYALRDKWQFVQMLTEWEGGTSADRSWKHVHMQLPLTLIALSGVLYYRREINLLALGEEEALSLGVDVPTVRWRLFLCVSLLTGAALAAMGVIAFFCMLLPHLVRLFYGSNAEKLLPACMAWGALSLATVDITLRAFDVHLLSIGNVSALIGGLTFLLLLTRKRSFSYA